MIISSVVVRASCSLESDIRLLRDHSERDAHTPFLNDYSLRSSESILLSRIRYPPFLNDYSLCSSENILLSRIRYPPFLNDYSLCSSESILLSRIKYPPFGQ